MSLKRLFSDIANLGILAVVNPLASQNWFFAPDVLAVLIASMAE